MASTLIRIPLLMSVALFLLAGSTSAAAKAPERELDLALVIGNNVNVSDEKAVLSYAVDDAVRIDAMFNLFHPAGASWLLADPDAQTDTTRLEALGITSQPPTREAFEQAIDEIRLKVKQARAGGARPIRLFFYFAGHGEQKGSLHLKDDLLTGQELKAALGRVGADVVVALLDGCYLGVNTRGEKRPSLPAPEEPIPRRPPWLGVIGSGTALPEYDSLHGGLLTRVALNGMRGLADSDGNGLVTFFELARYIQTQIDSLDIRVAKPARDPLTTIVDLRQGGGGLVLEPDFPQGQIAVRRVEKPQTTVAGFYHHGGKRERLRLPDGRYEVIRFVDPYVRKRVARAVKLGESGMHRYEARLYELELDRKSPSVLSRWMEPRMAYVVPKGQRGGDPLPPGMENAKTIQISDEEERALAGLTFKTTYQASDDMPTAMWSLEVLLDNPPQLAIPENDAAGFLNDALKLGAGIRVARVSPLFLKSRLYIGAGPLFQYGVGLQRNLYCGGAGDEACAYDSALRHQLRVGPMLTEAWIAPWVRINLEQSVTWAPGTVTDGRLGIVHDATHDFDPGVSFAQWRYVFLTDLVAEAGITVLLPLGSYLEIGPSFRASLTYFNSLSPEAPVPQISGGIEVRQRLLR